MASSTLAPLARDLRVHRIAKSDALALATRAGITPDRWQAELLESDANSILLNCCRQSGKSTMSAVLAVHTAISEDGALVLLLSPALRQSQELFRKAQDVYRLANVAMPMRAESALSLELANGSRIVSLPGTEKTIRGYSAVRLVVIDEASRVPDDFYYAVRPMLAVSGGRIIAPSTPFGLHGWWYDAWHSDEDWQRVKVTAGECPRLPSAFLEAERKALGDNWYRQEYEGEFLNVSAVGMFKRAWLEDSVVTEAPDDLEIVARSWDEAATKGGGDWTVGALVGMKAGTWYVLDVKREQTSPGGVDMMMDRCAQEDHDRFGWRYCVLLQQEPGSSGKARVEAHRQRLVGYDVRVAPASGSKELRARPFAAACEGERVKLLRPRGLSAGWIDDFIDECESFPDPRTHDDQVDAVSWAIGQLAFPDVKHREGGAPIVADAMMGGLTLGDRHQTRHKQGQGSERFQRRR